MRNALALFKTAALSKQLAHLLKADRSASAAAECAEIVMRRIARHGLRDPAVRNRQTKRGELRISNCVKYDLGSGYRLIGLVRGSSLYFVYAGTHDACDRWLERNRCQREVPGEDTARLCEYDIPVAQSPQVTNLRQDPYDEYEAQLAARLDEKTLRVIFSGICGPQ